MFLNAWRWYCRFILIHSIAVCIDRVHGHTWIDCLSPDREMVKDLNKADECPGHTTNFPGRMNPGEGGKGVDELAQWKISAVDAANPSTSVCPPPKEYDKPFFPSASGTRKRLKIAAGSSFFLGYRPNGHISKDETGRSTKWGVYWSGKSDNAISKMSDVKTENLIDGKMHDYDDGTCGERFVDAAGTIPAMAKDGTTQRGGSCAGEIRIPADTKPGIYTLAWVWKFYLTKDEINAFFQSHPKDPKYDNLDVLKVTDNAYRIPGVPRAWNNNVKYEVGGDAYSNCFEVEVTGGGGGGDPKPEGDRKSPQELTNEKKDEKKEEKKEITPAYTNSPPVTVASSPQPLPAEKKNEEVKPEVTAIPTTTATMTTTLSPVVTTTSASPVVTPTTISPAVTPKPALPEVIPISVQPLPTEKKKVATFINTVVTSEPTTTPSVKLTPTPEEVYTLGAVKTTGADPGTVQANDLAEPNDKGSKKDFPDDKSDLYTLAAADAFAATWPRQQK